MDIDIILDHEDITKAIKKIIDLKQPDKNLEIIYFQDDSRILGYKLDKHYHSQYMLVVDNNCYAYFEDFDDLKKIADMLVIPE